MDGGDCGYGFLRAWYNVGMEKKILEHEKFLEGVVKSGKWGEGVVAYHEEMVRNFQHERFIHLLVTFFFGVMAIVGIFMAFSVWCNCYEDGDWIFGMPFYLFAGVLTVLEVFYVKHYYFLENKIQALYKYSKILRKLK